MPKRRITDQRIPSGGQHSGSVGIIDIGSNSLRLVVYDAATSAPRTLYNEKAMCALGRGLRASGRLNPDGVGPAIESLERFVELSRAMNVGVLDCIATSAVRDASDGEEFLARVRARCNIDIRIISGDEEGHLSAAGVLSGNPAADGIVGDLGGGSVELVTVGPSLASQVASLPLGPLRLMGDSPDETAARLFIDQQIQALDWAEQARGKDFYAVGGAWRALARVHMEWANYPLHIIQGYSIATEELENFLELVFRQSRRSLDKVTSVARKRLETLPLSAYLLHKLLRKIGPRQVVFSGYGLREGLLFQHMPPEERGRDSLPVAARWIAENERRFGNGEALGAWTDRLFEDETPWARRLRLVAAILSDIGWSEHPDYRDERSFGRCLLMPVPGLDHAGRVFLGTALHARYGGNPEASILAPTRHLLDPALALQARALGLAFRLAYTLTGGAEGLIDKTSIEASGDALILTVPERSALYTGEAVQRRFDALARVLGRRGVFASPPDAAPAARKRA